MKPKAFGAFLYLRGLSLSILDPRAVSRPGVSNKRHNDKSAVMKRCFTPNDAHGLRTRDALTRGPQCAVLGPNFQRRLQKVLRYVAIG